MTTSSTPTPTAATTPASAPEAQPVVESLAGAGSFADAESREILNLLGDDAAGGSCCGGSCCA